MREISSKRSVHFLLVVNVIVTLTGATKACKDHSICFSIHQQQKFKQQFVSSELFKLSTVTVSRNDENNLNRQKKKSRNFLFSCENDDDTTDLPSTQQTLDNKRRSFSEHTENRRQVLLSLSSSILAVSTIFNSADVSNAASFSRQRAVGGAELECRERGDCLEKFELDGAIGWQWGAKDRCDASDPLCGADGRLLDEPLKGSAIPSMITGLDITHIASIDVTIGKGDGSQQGTLNIGLYANTYPEDVERFINFMDERGGIITSTEPTFGMVSTPVSLGRGGQMTVVYPRQKIDFGIPSQKNAYAKQVGRSTAKDVFEPQPIPSKTSDNNGMSASRRHDCAGLISVPAGGIGNGGGFGVSDDEAFANAFQITAMAIPSMDQERRKVIGQLLDQPSMALLDRLASLPPNKGLKGVIPGQSYGPPLLKVSVDSTQAVKATDKPNVGEDSLLEATTAN